MDLQLNATRRSVNDSVYLIIFISTRSIHQPKNTSHTLNAGVRFESRVFDLEAIQISGAVENELFILDSFSQRVVTVNAKPAVRSNSPF